FIDPPPLSPPHVGGGGVRRPQLQPTPIPSPRRGRGSLETATSAHPYPIPARGESGDPTSASDLRQRPARGKAAVPLSGILELAALVPEVHVGEAEALRVAFGPLEIVEQAPGVEGSDLRFLADGAGDRAQAAAVELEPPRVGHALALQRRVGVGAAVFGDLQDRVAVFTRHAHQELVEALGPDLPADVGERAVEAAEAQAPDLWARGVG